MLKSTEAPIEAQGKQSSYQHFGGERRGLLPAWDKLNYGFLFWGGVYSG